MNKTCSRCEKPVYPTELLSCLDKVWHKTCFKCQTCSMALNMKTYKGFNKLPYCEAHIPKAKATTVVETPEMKRLAENTKLQSQVQYHADFEKAKGKFTQVADDPETLRIKANTKIISNVSYHGELEKKAAMEQKRTLAGDEEGNNEHDDSGSAGVRSPEPVAEIISHHQRSTVPAHISPPQYHHQQQPQQQQQQQQRQQHHYQQQQQHHQQQHYQQQQPQQQQHHHHQVQQQQPMHHRQPDIKSVSSPPRAAVTAHHSDSPYSSRQTSSATLVYSSQPNALANQPQGRRIGSISDYDPINDNHGSLTQQYRPPQQQQQYNQQQQQAQQQKLQQYYQQQQRQHAMHLQQQQQQQQQAMQHLQQQHHYPGSVGVSSGYHQSANAQQRPSGRSFRAMYDYEADDDDEVSFRDGDVIVDCKSIDEGWMMGTVLRTGRSGMVPANYVEPIN